ncbi:hypothetical protein [Paenibacillus sp. FSL R10-2748]|uniref:hypothetical protein n=1 Tax=Paenibacillus sp. FSL R10-2748 TaxID=2954658 RepID=UPI0030FC75F7
MNIMIMVQFGSLFLIFFIAFILYSTRLWKASGLFGSFDVKSILLQLVLIAWAIVSFFVGLIKMIIVSGLAVSTIVLTMGIPILLIAFFSIKIYRNYFITRQELKRMKNASVLCKQWASSFPFISEENTQLKLHLREGKPEGKMIITNVTEEQASELYSQKQDLPKGIFLDVYPVKEDNKNLIH